jgi:outer membrane receptor protein involved in Fe transport
VRHSKWLKLVTGARWEHIGLDSTPFPSLVTVSKEYTPATGRFGAVFELTRSANVYASVSNAVEPTTQFVSLDASQSFSLTPGRQFEAGAKGGAFGDRLEGTFAYFAIERRDILISPIIDGIRTNQQVGKQTSSGIEVGR